jgi:rhamnose utilization protein RhaD (predicted bifunctional aldolase and dehydrogenase)/NAD(P)-dependent dehydrogenase (short-subunit alcohol dehydrogenase family)
LPGCSDADNKGERENMQNRYDEQNAQDYLKKYAQVPPELALRVYTSRLLGMESDLVLHGGGNTSVKAVVDDLLGEKMEVLFIKGSGWDLAAIEPAGFPALDLTYLRKLRRLEKLSDEEMVNQFRTHLLDATSPNPSIETLVHAFLPAKFIDHTHADAVVTLTHQQQAEDILQEALGPNIGILPFIMPGFPLAKAMAELMERRPGLECIVLMHHGLFTFGDDARIAYDRMIDYVSRAEAYLARAGKPEKTEAAVVTPVEPEMVLPLLRGALSIPDESGGYRHVALELRQSAELTASLARPDARQLFVSGVLTPDHVIRTKNQPLFLTMEGAAGEEAVARRIGEAVVEYEKAYDRYFREQAATRPGKFIRLDSKPKVVLIPGIGLVAAGATPKSAAIAADIAEHTLLAKVKGSTLGHYIDLDEKHIFDMEYWSLEQAKLGKGSPLPLQGRIALVTGGGGAIGAGICRQLLAAGSRVFLCDIDEERLQRVSEPLAARFGAEMVLPLVMDVTDEASVKEGLAKIVSKAGGLDILVPNAGIARVAAIADMEGPELGKVMNVNFMGVFQVIKAAIPIFRRQAIGGQIVINSSKNVFDPGAAFGAYSASKAAAHQLGKIAALELAAMGVGVNMINADAIFEDGDIASGLWEVVGPDRMRARNLDPAGLREYYRQRNLLKATVTADHVGKAVVFFASGQTPTTGATLPVDGGIPAAFPR